MSNERLEPVLVKFCHVEFVSVRDKGIDYYPISQLPFDKEGKSGFPVRPDNVQKSLKRLLGEGFQFVQLPTTVNPRKISCVSHDDLCKTIKHFARKEDSEFCWDLLEASVSTELKRANDYARKSNCLDSREWINLLN